MLSQKHDWVLGSAGGEGVRVMGEGDEERPTSLGHGCSDSSEFKFP